MSATICLNWREKVVFAAEGPQPQTLAEDDKLKVVLVGLEPGQKLPPHPAPLGVYSLLEGKGWMTVDGERFAVNAGAIIVAPAGAKRGIEAETRLVFIGMRGA